MRRLVPPFVALAVALLGLATPGLSPALAADPGYSVTPLHFKVAVGPEGDTVCDVVGDLYQPSNASPDNRMPAVLMTNGFGGSKDDEAGFAKYFASNGYVALSYSGLGFGGSSCKITLDDPDFDGKAASQLIDYLGAAEGIAFTDKGHTSPAPKLDSVKLDSPGDPRVGMLGVSYGGQVQYAAASVTRKLDTIVPIITWNDLSYSLAPNNTDQFRLPGQELVGVSSQTPGVVKQNWALGFSALGLTADLQNQQGEVPAPCPNFADFVCPALVTGAGAGTLSPDAIKALRHASVASYQDKVTIPTLILQGQADTLFNLNEAAATYRALEAQGTEVKMSWIEYGHSGSPAEGELDRKAPNPATQHITKRIVDWFAHYLKDDQSASTGPEFTYFRDWVDYSGVATKAYAQSDRFPVGSESIYHLSGAASSTATAGRLVTRTSNVVTGSQSFGATPGPVSTAEDPDVVDGVFQVPEDAERDLPGTYAQYDTDPLTRNVDVVGSPQARLKVEAPTAGAAQGEDLGKLVLFLKIADVDESGKAKVVRNLVAPVRVPNVNEAFTVKMPAFVHRFEAGHTIRFVVSGASPNYRGNNLLTPVKISTAVSQSAQTLTLPTLAAAPISTGTSGGGNSGAVPTPTPSKPDATTKDKPAAADASTTAASAAAPGPGSSVLPDTGGPQLPLLLVGLLLLAMGGDLVRRQRRAAVHP